MAAIAGSGISTEPAAIQVSYVNEATKLIEEEADLTTVNLPPKYTIRTVITDEASRHDK